MTGMKKATDIDWEAGYSITIDPETGDPETGPGVTTPEDWEWAITGREHGILGTIDTQGEIFPHVLGGMDVGFEFRFRADEDGNITAQGVCYAARKSGENIAPPTAQP